MRGFRIRESARIERQYREIRGFPFVIIKDVKTFGNRPGESAYCIYERWMVGVIQLSYTGSLLLWFFCSDVGAWYYARQYRANYRPKFQIDYTKRSGSSNRDECTIIIIIIIIIRSKRTGRIKRAVEPSFEIPVRTSENRKTKFEKMTFLFSDEKWCASSETRGVNYKKKTKKNEDARKCTTGA